MKKYLFTGLAILLPVALTLMIIIGLFDFFTTPFIHLTAPLVLRVSHHLSVTFPEGFTLFLSRIFSLLFVIFFIFILGAVARWFLVRNLLKLGHALVSRIPFVKSIYKTCREVFTALLGMDGKKAFKDPVRIPFPQKPGHALGFQSGQVPQECQDKAPHPLTSVFIPTAPHPISGFLFLVPQSDVQSINLSNEELLKFLVSCGMIVPSATPQQPELPQ